MNRNSPHTVESMARLLKDLEALESRATAQDLQLVKLNREKKSLEADLWKAQQKNSLLKKKLDKAVDLLKRVERSNENKGPTNLSKFFTTQVRQAVDDMTLNGHHVADIGQDHDENPF